MKLVCFCNYKPGAILGFDYRDKFEVGKTYTIVIVHYTCYVFSDLKDEWVTVSNFTGMFKPKKKKPKNEI